MNPLSRRSFLRRGSAAVVAVGALSALPGLPALIGVQRKRKVPSDAGAADAAVSETESVALSEPLVGHIRDLGTGEIGLLSGTREISLFDPQLAARLARVIR
jgi:hypothetical protein